MDNNTFLVLEVIFTGQHVIRNEVSSDLAHLDISVKEEVGDVILIQLTIHKAQYYLPIDNPQSTIIYQLTIHKAQYYLPIENLPSTM
jgi:hypothetical protein